MEGENKRKNYFIKKEFQRKLAIRFLGISSIGSVLAIILFNVLAQNKIDGVLYSMRIPVRIFRGNILLKEALFSNLAAALFITVIFIIATKVMFKRIAEPLRRIRTELQRLEGRDLSSGIALREGDEFKDFADELNTMRVELNRRFSTMKSRAQHLSDTAAELKRAGGPCDTLLIDRLTQNIDALERDISSFKR